MGNSVSGEEYWDLLTGKITYDELQRKLEFRNFQFKLSELNILFTKELEKISTINLSKMRRRCPISLRARLLPNSPWIDICNIAFKYALRGILYSRPNCPKGRDAREIRQKLSQMHHGNKKLKVSRYRSSSRGHFHIV